MEYPTHELLTLQEVAQLFRTTEKTIRRGCKRGDIPYVQPIKTILIPRVWVAEQLIPKQQAGKEHD